MNRKDARKRADEPTGNLDYANTQNIIGILCDLAHKKGYCVIIVTHDNEVAEAADVAYRMRDGVLQAEWNPTHIACHKQML